MIAKVTMTLEVDLFPTILSLYDSLCEIEKFYTANKMPLTPDALTAKFMLGRATGHTRSGVKLAHKLSREGKLVYFISRNMDHSREINKLLRDFNEAETELLRRPAGDLCIFTEHQFRGVSHQTPDLVIVDDGTDIKDVKNFFYNSNKPVKYLVLQQN